MESFVCKRCRHANDRSTFGPIHGIAQHYCTRCFAEDATGRRGFLGWFLMLALMGVHLFAGVAILGIPAGAALTLLGAEWFTKSPPLARASILLVPGVALGIVLWLRRRE